MNYSPKKTINDQNLLILQRDLAINLSASQSLNEGLCLCMESAIEISGMDCGGVYLVDDSSNKS